MYILILIISSTLNGSITSSSVEFHNEMDCLKAIPKILELEKGFRVKATCIRNEK